MKSKNTQNITIEVVEEIIDSTLGPIKEIKQEPVKNDNGFTLTAKCLKGEFQFWVNHDPETNQAGEYRLWINHKYIDDKNIMKMLRDKLYNHSNKYGVTLKK